MVDWYVIRGLIVGFFTSLLVLVWFWEKFLALQRWRILVTIATSILGWAMGLAVGLFTALTLFTNYSQPILLEPGILNPQFARTMYGYEILFVAAFTGAMLQTMTARQRRTDGSYVQF